MPGSPSTSMAPRSIAAIAFCFPAAMFSNTARAHELGKTHDWVVLYFDAGDGEHQRTVVTAGAGNLKGRRVVRGREAETEYYYRETEPMPMLFEGMP